MEELKLPIGLSKARKEQDKDFEIIKWYADEDCILCNGRGYTNWSKDLSQYIPCGCVERNLQIELYKREASKIKIATPNLIIN